MEKVDAEVKISKLLLRGVLATGALEKLSLPANCQ